MRLPGLDTETLLIYLELIPRLPLLPPSTPFTLPHTIQNATHTHTNMLSPIYTTPTPVTTRDVHPHPSQPVTSLDRRRALVGCDGLGPLIIG